MKKLLLALSSILLLAMSSLGQVGPSGPSKSPPQNQHDSVTFTASGQSAYFIDDTGTGSNQFGISVPGNAPAAPATMTVSIFGCMKGSASGPPWNCTGSALVTSTGATSQILATSGGPYDSYFVTETWTGGNATTSIYISRGALAKGSSGSGTGATIHGSLVASNCVSAFSPTQIQDAGAPCGTVQSVSGTAGRIVAGAGSTATNPVLDIASPFLPPGNVQITQLGGSADALSVKRSTNVSCGGTLFKGLDATGVTALAYVDCNGNVFGNSFNTINPSGVAGAYVWGQGTAVSGTANSWTVMAPTGVTGSPIEVLPTAAYTGFRYLVNSAGTMTPSTGELSGDVTTSGSLATTIANLSPSKLATQAALTVLSGPTSYGAANAAPSAQALVPQHLPGAYGQCAVHDSAICKSGVDANGNPNYVAAGTGGAVTVTGTGLVLINQGVYQTGTGTYTNVVTGTTSSFNYLYVKQDTANANLVAGDFGKTINAPVYSYKSPTACTGATGTDPQYWFDLSSRQWKVSTAAACSFSVASPQVIFLAVFWVTATPTVSGVAHEPFNLSPYRRYELFGDGFDANSGQGGSDIVKQEKTSGTTTIDNWHQYTSFELTGATVNPTAWSIGTLTSAGNTFVWSQNPVLIVNTSTVSANSSGRVGGVGTTGACASGNQGGIGGNGGGGGGASATNAGCVSGGHYFYSTATSSSAGGTAGTVGNPGGNGSAAPAGTPVLAPFSGLYFTGSSGGSGGGDGTNAAGSGGAAGGGIVIRAPSVVEDASSTISANGGAGVAAAGGNSGGGGGGGGGVALVEAGFYTLSGTFTTTGGALGTKAGTGGNGGTGGTGLAVSYKLW